MRLFGRTLAAAAAAAAVAAPAEAQMVSAKNPASLVAALKAKGYPAELGGAKGDPSISSSAGDLKFKIYFENCTAGKACTTVTFFTGFTDLDATHAKLNEWNAKNRFARAYIDDENDPVLQMDVDLDFKGIPTANFNEYIDIWSSSASKYLTFLRGK
ncbi:MAG TPA: YbjN domain-containing protein [Allosphingosinicella sp.]|jgi:hypothetical protein